VSVSEAHQIAERVRYHVMRSINDVTDVTVHIDPEDDGIWAPDPNLPTREVLLKELHHRWAPLGITDHIERIDLHYLKGQISVDVILRLDAAEGVKHAKELAGKVAAAVDDLEFLRRVKVFYC
jgi:divalent metal cation (Fe/Co/Zn/Cd) transporter